MLNGTSVPYATVKLNEFEFIPDTEIIYLGHTTQKPMDMVPRYGKDYEPNIPSRITLIAYPRK